VQLSAAIHIITFFFFRDLLVAVVICAPPGNTRRCTYNLVTLVVNDLLCFVDGMDRVDGVGRLKKADG